MEIRPTSEFWVKAYLRRCMVEGVAAMQVRRGQPSSGAVLICLNRLDGHSKVLQRGTLSDGRSGWLNSIGPAPDAEVEAFIRRQIKFDPDLWVVEVEDPQGRHFLDDPVEA